MAFSQNGTVLKLCFVHFALELTCANLQAALQLETLPLVKYEDNLDLRLLFSHIRRV